MYTIFVVPNCLGSMDHFPVYRRPRILRNSVTLVGNKMSDRYEAIKSLLLRAKDLSNAKVEALESLLCKEKLLSLKAIAKDL